MKISKELEDKIFEKFEEQIEIAFGELTQDIREAILPLHRKIHSFDIDAVVTHGMEYAFDNLMESKHKQMTARDKARRKASDKAIDNLSDEGPLLW